MPILLAKMLVRGLRVFETEKEGLTNKECPEIRNIGIWLDDHMKKPDGLASISIATHKRWITVDLKPHKQYWKYTNTGWKPASVARWKPLDAMSEYKLTSTSI